jgi:hypothetical protein
MFKVVIQFKQVSPDRIAISVAPTDLDECSTLEREAAFVLKTAVNLAIDEVSGGKFLLEIEGGAAAEFERRVMSE